MRCIAETVYPVEQTAGVWDGYKAHATRAAFNKLAASIREQADKDAIDYDLVKDHHDFMPLCRVTVSLNVFSDEELRKHEELVIQKYIGGIRL